MKAKLIKNISEIQALDLILRIDKYHNNDNIIFNDIYDNTILDIEINSISKLGTWSIIIEKTRLLNNDYKYYLIIFFNGRRESFKNGCYYLKWHDNNDNPINLGIFDVYFNINAIDFKIETSMPDKPLFTIINNNSKSVWQKVINYLF